MSRIALVGLFGISVSLLAACGDAGQGTLVGGASQNASDTPGAGTSDVDAGGGGAGAGTIGGGGTTGGGPSGGGTSGGGGTSDAGGGGGTPPTTTGDAGATPPPPSGAGIPCDVAAMLAAKCTSCHADPPLNGSLSGLVTLADLLATSKEDPTKNVAQASLARMQSASAPMPPASVGSPASSADIQALQSWINGNYVGSCADAGAAPPPAGNVFTGAPAFVSQTAGSTHTAGLNCMGGCHNHGFTFAGTLTDGNGKGVAGAEVRLVDAKGVAISVHTGSNGNFHSSTSFTGPAHVGARNAATTVVMATALQPANGGCNGCHTTGGTTTPIHLP